MNDNDIFPVAVACPIDHDSNISYTNKINNGSTTNEDHRILQMIVEEDMLSALPSNRQPENDETNINSSIYGSMISLVPNPHPPVPHIILETVNESPRYGTMKAFNPFVLQRSSRRITAYTAQDVMDYADGIYNHNGRNGNGNDHKQQIDNNDDNRQKPKAKMYFYTVVGIALIFLGIGFTIDVLNDKENNGVNSNSDNELISSDGSQFNATAPQSLLNSTTGTCGKGSRGNGRCANDSLCCSEFGWCMDTPQHCPTTEEHGGGEKHDEIEADNYEEGSDGSVSNDNGDGCCSNNYFDCDVSWCGSTRESCESCNNNPSVIWLDRTKVHQEVCLPRWITGCGVNSNHSIPCCGLATCVVVVPKRNNDSSNATTKRGAKTKVYTQCLTPFDDNWNISYPLLLDHDGAA